MRQTRILEMIAADPALDTLWREMQPCDEDSAHDRGHLLRVARWTLILVQGEVSARICIAAALLHDAVNVPKDSPLRAQASQLSAQHTRQRLEALGFPEAEILQAEDAVLNHSFSRGQQPSTRLGRALQDADRLEALGAVGLWRTAAVGYQMNAAFADLRDPWAMERPLQDRTFSVDHFFTKLLRLPDSLHHEAARQEAQRRVALMVDFLHQLGHELGEPPPPQRLPPR